MQKQMRVTRGRSAAPVQLIAMFAALALLSACALDGEAPEAESEVTAASTGGNVVTTWAAIARDAISRPVEESTTLITAGPGTMLMAQVQLAVYDAMVAIYRDHEPFSYTGFPSHPTSKDAAAATAAYRVLRTRVPGRAAYLDAQYAATMAAIKHGNRKTNGIALGEDVAAHYLALRANDNIGNSYTWVQPPTGPGVFERTAATQPGDYKLVFIPPFTFDISETSSFFPPPPPALTSSEYAAAWAEVRDLGRVDSAIRTEAQKQLALWAAESPFRWAARNLNELAVAKKLGRMKAARFFAFVFTSMADSLQTGWSAKYHYNLWRPFHAVPRADIDGNDATVGDVTWTPLLNANHPEYPSGHGVYGAGSLVEAVRTFFGTDAVSWTLTAGGVNGLTETTRSYTALSALSDDIKDARILAGLHYRFGVDAGHEQGRKVVEHISARFFRPVW